jgi:hypothetical protein
MPKYKFTVTGFINLIWGYILISAFFFGAFLCTAFIFKSALGIYRIEKDIQEIKQKIGE